MNKVATAANVGPASQRGQATRYAIAQEVSYGVRPDDTRAGKHHAYNVKTTDIIYSGSFEDCVRAIHRQTLEDKAALGSCESETPKSMAHSSRIAATQSLRLSPDKKDTNV